MRRPTIFRAPPLLASILGLAGCADVSKLPESAAYGPDPELPKPCVQRLAPDLAAKAPYKRQLTYAASQVTPEPGTSCLTGSPI